MKSLLPKTSKNPQGFTLVELLIAVTIIAVLAVIGVTVYSGVQKSARDSRRRADIESISKAWEAAFIKGNTAAYPQLSAAMFSSGAIPTDPQTSGQYNYNAATATNATDSRSGTTYNVCATLEAGGTFCRSNQQ